MSTLFSKIISGEIEAYKVAESIDFLAFLDVSPLAEGHTLVIPKKEVDYIFDLDDETYNGLMIFTKIVAEGIKKVIPCKKVGVAVIGLDERGERYEFFTSKTQFQQRRNGSHCGEN